MSDQIQLCRPGRLRPMTDFKHLVMYGVRWSSSRTSAIAPPDTAYWSAYREKCQHVRNSSGRKVNTMIGQHLRLVEYVYGAVEPHLDTGIQSESVTLRRLKDDDMTVVHYRPVRLPTRGIVPELRKIHNQLHCVEDAKMSI